MKVLVTLLTWNRRKILKRILNSLLKRNDELDILAWDNGSTDKTCDLLKSMDIETINSPSNIGVFAATSKLWMEAHRRGYDFVINLQDDFPCINTIPINDMIQYLNENQDVGFILLNNKKTVTKISDGKKIL
jgi:GT2 family glycosyltransferase